MREPPHTHPHHHHHHVRDAPLTHSGADSEEARLHHANRCCDSLSDPPPAAAAPARAATASAAQPPAVAVGAPRATPARAAAAAAAAGVCVVCGKDISKLKNQTDHMKRCAKRVGMPTARLLELIREGGSERGGGAAAAAAPRGGPRDRPQERGKENLAAGGPPTAGAPALGRAQMPKESAIVSWLREAGLTKFCPVRAAASHRREMAQLTSRTVALRAALPARGN